MFYGLSSPSVTSSILLLVQVQQGRGQPLQHGGGGRGLHLGREVGIVVMDNTMHYLDHMTGAQVWGVSAQVP